MNPSRDEMSNRAILGDEVLAIAWLAENGILPARNRAGRVTLREPPGQSMLTRGEKLLIVSKFDIDSEADLKALQEEVRNHPRWAGD